MLVVLRGRGWRMDIKFGGNYLITCTYIVFIVGMLELDMLISVGPFVQGFQ